MGLRLIKEMIESLEGTFEIHSSPGKGTRLLVSLPVEKPDPHSVKGKG
jgi:signal transduction histidine kinase